VSSSYNFVKPVLKCLKDMESVPLAEELVYGDVPKALQYITPDVVEQVWFEALCTLDIPCRVTQQVYTSQHMTRHPPCCSPLQELLRLSQSLDASQHRALELALTSRVALIQVCKKQTAMQCRA
jgi:hypothetical protein